MITLLTLTRLSSVGEVGTTVVVPRFDLAAA